MRYSFRLAELVGHMPDPRKRPGTIKEIVEHTGLDRHQVAALLKNEVKYIPLKALSRLCDYLVERGYVAADALPGALFSVEPENFWELLARRRRLELCLGVRRGEAKDWEGAWVVASDSILLGELLNGVSTLGGTRHYRGVTSGENGGTRGPSNAPHPEHLKQTLVWSPGQGTLDEVIVRAKEVYDDFAKSGSDKALVCMGSVKSNPVVELMIAEAFGGVPFQEEKVATPKKRTCPFFLRYRKGDPHPESCSSGLTLSQSTPTEEPGLYYETAKGEWAHCSWDAPEHDAALVFYVHRESQGRLEMALSGYSGRATRQLAKTLAARAQDFWPPIYEGHGMQIGAFIVQYTYSTQPDRADDLLRTDIVANTKIIPLDGRVIERRMEQNMAGVER